MSSHVGKQSVAEKMIVALDTSELSDVERWLSDLKGVVFDEEDNYFFDQTNLDLIHAASKGW